MSIPDPKNKQNEYTFPVDCTVLHRSSKFSHKKITSILVLYGTNPKINVVPLETKIMDDSLSHKKRKNYLYMIQIILKRST